MTIFSKIFGKNSSEDQPQKTIPIDEARPIAEFPDESVSDDDARIRFAYATSTGITRDENQDTVVAITKSLIDVDRDIRFGLFIVADGMGGHHHGAAASRIASETLSTYILDRVIEHFSSGILTEAIKDSDYLKQMINSGFREAHQDVKAIVAGGGTTLTSLLVVDDTIVIGHVGDSRIYQITNGNKIDQLTRDHSLVNRLIELGKLSSEEIKYHPQRNILYQAIGQMDHDPEPELANLSLDKEICLLICSDGLWGVVPDEDILTITNQSDDFSEISQLLINFANAKGGPDNISVAILEI